MAMRRIDDDAIDARVDQHFRPREPLVADGGGGGDAQASCRVLAGRGMQRRLFNILDRDQADAAVIRVHHQQLFNAVLVQQAARLVLVHAFAHGDKGLGHQFRHRLRRIVGEADIAIGQYADQLAGTIFNAARHHRNAGNRMPAHQS